MIRPSSTRARFRGSMTVPIVVVKTSPVSSQYGSRPHNEVSI
jgi:hypothetical protein